MTNPSRHRPPRDPRFEPEPFYRRPAGPATDRTGPAPFDPHGPPPRDVQRGGHDHGPPPPYGRAPDRAADAGHSHDHHHDHGGYAHSHAHDHGDHVHSHDHDHDHDFVYAQPRAHSHAHAHTHSHEQRYERERSGASQGSWDRDGRGRREDRRDDMGGFDERHLIDTLVARIAEHVDEIVQRRVEEIVGRYFEALQRKAGGERRGDGEG